MTIDSIGGGKGQPLKEDQKPVRSRSVGVPSSGPLDKRTVAVSNSPHLHSTFDRATFDHVPLGQRSVRQTADHRPGSAELSLHYGDPDQRNINEDIGLPEKGELSPDDVRNFLGTHIAAAKRLLATRHPLSAGIYKRLVQLENSIQNNPPFPRKGGRVDHARLQEQLQNRTQQIRSILKDAGVSNTKIQQHQARQEYLVSSREWRTGYRTEIGTAGHRNPYSPIEQFGAGNDVSAATSHHFITSQPTNAWKTGVQGANGDPLLTFYRHGTFAPQPGKVGQDWSGDKKKQVATDRAETMAKSMAADYIRNHKGRVGNRLNYTLSNVNLMRQGAVVNEDKLTDLQKHALNNLNGRTLSVHVDGEDYQVEFEVRQWRQDVKDGPYFADSHTAGKVNRQAVSSVKQEIEQLRASGRVAANDLNELEAMARVVDRQVNLHQRSGFRRAFAGFVRSMSKRLFGIKFRDPIMDNSELSAIIINLESKLAEHRPGGVSEGCKSGKDRGSLVDVTSKALAIAMETNRQQGKRPMAGIRPGWMLARVKSDPEFRRQMGDLFKANFKLQELNTGFKGYITRDLASLVGHQNYMEKVAEASLDEIKAGSDHIKS